MSGERHGLRLAGGQDPVWRLWSQLPAPWRGPVIGDDVEGWESITENGDYRINLTGLPEVIQAELAWMAHWQAADGTRSSVLAISQLANILRRAISEGRPFPASIRQMDWDDAAALQSWFYASRWGRFPPHGVRARLRVIFRFARTALIAACHDGHWWELDYWHPRCDSRIPLSEREPQAHYGCSPALIARPWLKEAAKWYLGTILESGALRWSTVSQERLPCLHRFDRWLATAFDDPREVLADPAAAGQQSAAFRRWAADPANRSDPGGLAGARRKFTRDWSTTTCGRSPNYSPSWPPTRPKPAVSSAFSRHRGRPSPTPTPPAGCGRSPGSRTREYSTRPTTSMTTPSRRSPPHCRCSGCPAVSRCSSREAMESRSASAASATRRPCA